MSVRSLSFCSLIPGYFGAFLEGPHKTRAELLHERLEKELAESTAKSFHEAGERERIRWEAEKKRRSNPAVAEKERVRDDAIFRVFDGSEEKAKDHAIKKPL